MNDFRLYPIAVIEDRYMGTYIGGSWIAIANCNEQRFEEVMEGAHGGDPDAAEFGRNKPEWIAVGNSPDEAIRNLKQSHRTGGVDFLGLNR